MKVAYLGKIQLSDIDLSYLNEAQRLADITYFMEITPRFLKGPAFNIAKIYPQSGVFKAVDAYPEFRKFEGFIDLDKFYVVNTCGRFWMLKAFWTNFLLLLFLIRGKFKVVHTVWPPNVYEFSIYFLRKRMMLTVHDPFPHSGLDTRIVRFRRKVAFSLIPKLIILNKSQLRQFEQYYHIAEERITVSRLSSYTYLRTIKAPSNLRPAKPYILFFGKISPYKGLNYLLPAMLEVHRSAPDCHLVVAGGGNFSFDVSPYRELDYIELRNRFIPEDELVSLIVGARFVVCPYTDATQSGVIMSAFAFNKPVLATNVGGLPEMVRHNEFGYIIENCNSKAISDAILSLWTDPDKLETFSENIRMAYTDGDLSWKDIAKKMVANYLYFGQKA